MAKAVKKSSRKKTAPKTKKAAPKRVIKKKAAKPARSAARKIPAKRTKAAAPKAGKPAAKKAPVKKTALSAAAKTRHSAVKKPAPGKSARKLSAVRKPIARATLARLPRKAASLPASLEGIVVRGAMGPRFDEILTPEALAFLGALHRKFDPQRRYVLARRTERQKKFDAGWAPDFLPDTRRIRDADWKISPVPADLLDRRVEITGPVDRKMIINALNSGAKVFMADFEDASSPVWTTMVEGQINLKDRWSGRIDFKDPASGKSYALAKKPAVLMVRPRGLHLPEAHVEIDGQAMSGSFFDFGLYVFHNARAQVKQRATPAFYIPKLESHIEARLWNDVFSFAEQSVGLAPGTLKCTVLIETIPAAFEMDEILYELRTHIAGLNCGRWDYIFSFIKRLGKNPKFLTPDRAAMGMGKSFLAAYSALLIKTCHRRGAYAMGGMAAQIPVKNDPAANEAAFAKVRADKEREAVSGHDGTWVAHPDLVPVAMEVFNRLMPGANQLANLRADVEADAGALLEVHEGGRSEAGLRENIRVGVQYIEAWLRGRGAVPLYNLMEDAATAEISRAQIWQWLRHRARLDDGRDVTPALFREVMADEMKKIAAAVGAKAYKGGRFVEAERLFAEMSLAAQFEEFLTLPAYQLLN